MKPREARALIEPAVRGAAGVWADVGAGTGTFTRALLELLGDTTTVYAIDRDASALERVPRSPSVVTVVRDFTQSISLPGFPQKLDGMLLANALHFAKDAGAVLERLVEHVKPGGRVVLVEYDQRSASRWVPYPIPVSALPALAEEAALSKFSVLATRPSMYHGTLYCAVAVR